MKIAIVAILAVGAVGLTIGGLTMTEAYHPILPKPSYPPNISIYTTGLCVSPGGFSNSSNFVLSSAVNKTPWTIEVTAEYNNEQKTTIVPANQTRGFPNPETWECEYVRHEDVPIISGKIFNMTDTESFEIFAHLQEQPTGFYGDVREFAGPVVADVEIIVVNVADHTDVKRTTTNSKGEYFIRTAPGGYLIQAIGGGPDAYKYTTTKSGLELVNLTYN